MPGEVLERTSYSIPHSRGGSAAELQAQAALVLHLRLEIPASV
jgi:hypothetical protein